MVFTGKVEVPAGRLFEWVQAALAPLDVLLVPNGPLAAYGRHWIALDQANPAVQSRPLFVHWEDVDRLAHRDQDRRL